MRTRPKWNASQTRLRFQFRFITDSKRKGNGRLIHQWDTCNTACMGWTHTLSNQHQNIYILRKHLVMDGIVNSINRYLYQFRGNAILINSNHEPKWNSWEAFHFESSASAYNSWEASVDGSTARERKKFPFANSSTILIKSWIADYSFVCALRASFRYFMQKPYQPSFGEQLGKPLTHSRLIHRHGLVHWNWRIEVVDCQVVVRCAWFGKWFNVENQAYIFHLVSNEWGRKFKSGSRQ